MVKTNIFSFLASNIIAVLVLFASFQGILNKATYSKETANWAMQAVGQDIGNLIAIPFLLISTFFLTKKSIQAFFVWIGTLLYFIYAYMIYAFFIHFNYLFLVYLAVLGLSVYTVIGALIEQNLNLFARLNFKNIKAASILLIAIGSIFTLLWLSEVVTALLTGQLPASVIATGLWVNPIHVIDLALVLPAMIMTGILLWKNKLFGHIMAAPWLTFAALMGTSIVATMVLELKKGNSSVLPPFTMVSTIVISSVIVLFHYLKELNK